MEEVYVLKVKELATDTEGYRIDQGQVVSEGCFETFEAANEYRDKKKNWEEMGWLSYGYSIEPRKMIRFGGKMYLIEREIEDIVPARNRRQRQTRPVAPGGR